MKRLLLIGAILVLIMQTAFAAYEGLDTLEVRVDTVTTSWVPTTGFTAVQAVNKGGNDNDSLNTSTANAVHRFRLNPPAKIRKTDRIDSLSVVFRSKATKTLNSDKPGFWMVSSFTNGALQNISTTLTNYSPAGIIAMPGRTGAITLDQLDSCGIQMKDSIEASSAVHIMTRFFARVRYTPNALSFSDSSMISTTITNTFYNTHDSSVTWYGTDSLLANATRFSSTTGASPHVVTITGLNSAQRYWVWSRVWDISTLVDSDSTLTKTLYAGNNAPSNYLQSIRGPAIRQGPGGGSHVQGP
jgi:hypothetical protein